MPREFVIPVSTALPFEAAAKFIAAMTYPDYEAARRRYEFGLCHWAITQRAKLDKEWRISEVLLRPDYVFWNSEKRSDFKKSHLYFKRLLAVGAFNVLPYIPKFLGQKKVKTFDGLEANPENCILSAMATLGFDAGSITTVRSRYWKPAKPVCHALAGFMAGGMLLEAEGGEEWLESGSSPLVEIFFNPKALDMVMNFAEKFREHIATIDGIRVDPNQLVRFTKG